MTAFYSAHGGTPLFHRTTTLPARVASWGPERTVPTNTPGPYGYTYPNPVWSPLESRLYLFWRGGNFLPSFSTSEDEGATWAPARTLMNDNEPQSSQRPYVKYASRNGVIHLAYNQAHPRNRPTSLFYMRYTPGSGWQRAGGTALGEPPFIPTDGDRVYDAFEFDMRSWVHDIAVGADGHPRTSSDYLRVRVAGATTSTVFEPRGAASDRDGAWAATSVSLDPFAGQTVRIVIEAADAGGASLVEAAVDDVRVTGE